MKKPKLDTEGTDTNGKSLIEHDLSGSGSKFGTGNSKTSNGKSTPNHQNDYGKKCVGCGKFMSYNAKGITLPVLEEGMLALPAPEGMLATPAPEGMLPLPAPEGMLAMLAPEGMLALPALEGILALPAPEAVLALPAPEAVLALPAPEAVLALPAPEAVLALPAPEAVLALPAPEAVLALPAPEVMLALPAPEVMLALPYSKEGSTVDIKKPHKKNDEADNNRKSLIELNLKRSDKEISAVENVPMVSASFSCNYGKKEDNLEEGGNEIAIKKINFERKSRLEKHKPQDSNKKKVNTDLSCYEKIKSKIRKSRERKAQHDDKKKIDPELRRCGFKVGFGEEKLLADGMIKSKVVVEDKLLVDGKIKSKVVVEDKLLENDDAVETSRFKLKKNEPQGNHGEKIDPEMEKHKPQDCNKKKVNTDLSCYEKIKSKRRRSRKRKTQDDDKGKIDPESRCCGFEVRFGEEKLLADGKIKSKVVVEDKLLADGKIESKVVVEDKLLENDDATETSRFKLKKNEPQSNHGEKIDPELEKHKPQDWNKKVNTDLSCYEKINSKRRRSRKRKAQDDDKEKIDLESRCCGFEVGFGEEKLLTDGKIKSKVVVEDKLLENDDTVKTSRFKLKKNEPQGNNGEKIDPELYCNGSAGRGDVAATEKIKSKSKKRSKKCEPQGNHGEKNDPELCGSAGKGDVAATEKIKSKSKSKKRSKKCESQDNNGEKIDPESHRDDCDIQFVENKQLVDGIIKFEEKKKAVEVELQETGDDTESKKFKLKKTRPEIQKYTVQVGVRSVSPSFHNDSAKMIHAKPLDKGGKSEPFPLPTSEDLMGDKVEDDSSRVQIYQQGQDGRVFSVVLTSTEKGSGFESISIKFKKKTVEESAKACHCSQIDNLKKSVEVEALEYEQGLKGNGKEIETIKVKSKKNRKSDDKKQKLLRNVQCKV